MAGLFLKGAVVGAALTFSVGFLAFALRDTPRPSIFASLPTNTVDIAPAVDQAVRAEFPIGASEDRVISVLSAMGFVIRQGEEGLWADYTAGGSLCTESFVVSWETRPDDLISDISGDYHLSCL